MCVCVCLYVCVRVYSCVHCVLQINTFARAWMSWVSQHGGVSAIKGGYLHLAEPFVTHFLDCMARGDVGALLGTRDKVRMVLFVVLALVVV